MNEEQFKAFAKLTRLRKNSCSRRAIHLYLVKKMGVTDIANRLGIGYVHAWNAIKAAQANVELIKKVCEDQKNDEEPVSGTS